MKPFQALCSFTIAAALVCGSPASRTAFASELDRILLKENSEQGVKLQPTDSASDLAFARRVCLDLAGRIPTGREISQYLKWPKNKRREMLISQYMQDEGFANRWSAFFADVLRIRSNQEGGTALLAYVHNAIETDMPYDEMCRRMISVNGKAGRTPEIGFVLGDDADPMALASATAQVFMGIRISCAQCHDHPFDKWTREDFYGVAAFFGKTQRMENNLTRTVYTTEGRDMMVQWPPEDESEPEERKPMKPVFPFDFVDEGEKPDFLVRFEKLKAERLAIQNKTNGPSIDDLLAASSSKVKSRLGGGLGKLTISKEAKQDIRKIDVQADLYKMSEMRANLAEMVTSPRNRYFARTIVNRVWRELMGRAFVEPVDDFREDNPASHPKTMDYLAEEFVANGFSFRWLVQTIVLSDTYARAHVGLDVDEKTRGELESAFLATAMRRMRAEALYDSIVTAGHLFDVKHLPGQNPTIVKTRIRVPIEPEQGTESEVADSQETEENTVASSTMMVAEEDMMASAANYGLEQAIELDFKALLSMSDDAPMVDQMAKMTREELEAMRMKDMPQRQPGMKYTTKVVEKTVDDNPKFSSAYRMATPAPMGHFLRLFGQPGRTDLGDDRYDNASMRQALMMLNGRLTNEASRIGQLEPVYKLLVGSQADYTRAIQYTYGEFLTRMPTAQEIAEAKQIIEEGEDPLTGMADFRWILLNSNEFRFIP
ncbi:MAG: DUF1553 domain-containing protein [Planctomycetota bacterium]